MNKPTDRELEIRREMQTCKHFTGTHRTPCKAGVDYRALVGGPDLGWGLRIPCHTIVFDHAKDVVRVSCDKRELPTREEAEATVAAGDAAMERHKKAIRVAHDDAKAKGLKKGHGGVSDVACPNCDGKISYSVAAYNGHMHAACSTKGCVAWME